MPRGVTNNKDGIWSALRGRFPDREFALLREVRDAAGFSASNSADGIAMNLWPSRGLEIHGIEIKSGRGDWLKEMKSPHKAENIFQYCDRFWLIAANESVVLNISEIPKSWGYILIKNDRCKTLKEAPALKPKPLNRHFVAAMLKRATNGFIHPTKVDELIAKRVESSYNEHKNDLIRTKHQLKNLQKTLADFESASGIKLDGESQYSFIDGNKIGGIVKLIMEGGSDIQEATESLMRIKKVATNIVSKIDDTMSLLKINVDDVSTEHPKKKKQ